MIDFSQLQSGFDAEILLNRRYVRYMLMNSIETGSLPLQVSFPFEFNDNTSNIVIDLYMPEDYQRNYTINANAVLPANTSPDSFDCEILFDNDLNADMRIRIVGDVTGILAPFTSEVIDLFTTFELLSDTDDNGNQRNARLSLKLVDMTGDMIDIILSIGGMTKEELLGLIKPYIDRDIPLSMVGQNQQVQKVAMQKLAGADSDTDVIGLYLNLLLRTGPAADEVRGDRGDLANAINFLPAGENLAFGMAGSIYTNISTDAFERTAMEEPEGSGNFSHPIKQDPSDPNSETIGIIKDITISPKKSNSGEPLDELLITVYGELIWDLDVLGVDIVPDPDFRLYITLSPKVKNGIIEWDISYDIDFDPLYKIIINVIVASLLAAIFIASMGTAAIAIGAAAFVLLFVLEDAIVEPLIATAIGNGNKEMFDTSFLSAMPNRLTIETKRWDPFYFTNHQILALTEAVLFRDEGLGFSGKAMLDKQPEFVTHIVIRQESRNTNGALESLQYRVKDHDKSANDFINNFPGTDRRDDYVKVADDAETNLYALTLAQVEARIQDHLLIPRILYDAKKVHLENNQVKQILAISRQEVKEIKTDLENTFSDEKETAVREEQGDALREEAITELTAETGNTPTEEQIETRVSQKVDVLVADALKEYTETQLDADTAAAINTVTRFDLPPHEMASIQMKLMMMLSGLDIVVRKGKPYYRDRADGFVPDNLMELPKYNPAEE